MENNISNPPRFNSSSNCLVKKYLSNEYWRKACNWQTGFGSTLQSMLISGIKNADSEVGIYAGDAECYELFDELINPIIGEFHCLKRAPCHAESLNNIKFSTWKLTGAEIITTRIRFARNVSDYPFSAKISKDEREDLESKVTKVLSDMPGPWSGEYYQFSSLSRQHKTLLKKHHLLFSQNDRFQAAAGITREWPCGRGVYLSHNKQFGVCVNEEDHLRIISIQPGGDLHMVYRNLKYFLEQIESRLAFVSSAKLGFLASCPSNVGTGMRASVHIRLPQLEKHPHRLESLVAEHGLVLRGTAGEHSDVNDSIFDISNKQRLGKSEEAFLQDLVDGVRKVLSEERRLNN